MAAGIQATFISQKINRIRWKPDPFNNCHSFITGSWDEDQNSIKLWDFRENEEGEIHPFLLSELAHNGDVTEALFLDTDNFACSSSFGSVSYYKINYKKTRVTIEEQTTWKNIHKFCTDEISSCTSIAAHDKDIVSVGEDGRINLMTLSSKSVVRSYDNADSCPLKCVLFLKHNEILISNLRGQLKIFDTRSKDEKPANFFTLSGDIVAPTCLRHHPTQRHLLLAGDEQGAITIWDLRQNTYPINLLKAHDESVTDIQFHPDDPDQLFTSSIGGDLWQWTIKNKMNSILDNMDNSSAIWANSQSFKKNLEVNILIENLHKPINSLDVNQLKLLCSCDNEAIYLINDLKLHNF